MNLHHPTPDPDPALDALLDQALDVGEVPAELQDRILALTDPGLNALLDQALAPPAAPDGLDTRILERLDPQPDPSQEAGAVLATIGPRRHAWVGYAAAAAVVLATGLAFYYFAAPSNTPDEPIVEAPNAPAVAEETLAGLDQDTEFETEIDTLQDRILTVGDTPIWGDEDDFQRELWNELAPDEESVAMLF